MAKEELIFEFEKNKKIATEKNIKEMEEVAQYYNTLVDRAKKAIQEAVEAHGSEESMPLIADIKVHIESISTLFVNNNRDENVVIELRKRVRLFQGDLENLEAFNAAHQQEKSPSREEINVQNPKVRTGKISTVFKNLAFSVAVIAALSGGIMVKEVIDDPSLIEGFAPEVAQELVEWNTSKKFEEAVRIAEEDDSDIKKIIESYGFCHKTESLLSFATKTIPNICDDPNCVTCVANDKLTDDLLFLLKEYSEKENKDTTVIENFEDIVLGKGGSTENIWKIA